MYLDLAQDIKNGKIAPAYIFCGEEKFLMLSTLDLLIEQIAPDGENSFNLDRLDAGNLNLRELVNIANMPPFFADRKLILVDNAPWFSVKPHQTETEETEEAETKSEQDRSDPGIDEMLAYLADPSPTTCLVFLPIDKINRTKKLTKAIGKCGTIAEFKPLNRYEMSTWLDQQLQQLGITMSSDAREHFLFVCGSSCSFAYQELMKLSWYKGDETQVSLSDVEAIVSNNTMANIFQLIDRVAEGNLDKSLLILDELLLSENEYTIIPVLANHFRNLLMTKSFKQRGYDNKMIMDLTGQRHAFVIEKALRQSAKYSEVQLARTLEILLQADKKGKTGIAPIRDCLETAIIQICYLIKR